MAKEEAAETIVVRRIDEDTLLVRGRPILEDETRADIARRVRRGDPDFDDLERLVPPSMTDEELECVVVRAIAVLTDEIKRVETATLDPIYASLNLQGGRELTERFARALTAGLDRAGIRLPTARTQSGRPSSGATSSASSGGNGGADAETPRRW